jgi:pyruvate dehydrogenase E2 component (dihydrolipoamide acetyltransferase)
MSEERRIPLKGMRGVIAERMHKSLSESAQLSFHRKADITELMDSRKEFNKKTDVKVTITDLLVKIVSLTLLKHPDVNGWIDASEIRLMPEVHMGLAVALEDGLIVPVIRNADKKSLKDISQEAKDLAERTKNGKIRGSECVGSTFTLTNLGMMGIEYFTPIINLPELAILGVGASMWEPYLDENEQAWLPRLLLPLSLTVNHCAVDGAPAAAFLKSLCETLGNTKTVDLWKI